MAHGYLLNVAMFGYQAPNRSSSKRPGAGRLRFHALGCRADGGDLSTAACAKCAETAPDEYRQLLKRLDQRSA